ncbi:DUF835 domain-containing protein [Thermococcus sp. MV11]|uniref:DUF835 domain-containing protein n=1 Tax=Thermococcus sp. MV11 TaxID=1638267 RepID=UPI00352D0CA5
MRNLAEINTLLLAEALIVMGVDLGAAAWIFRIYLSNGRKSALAFSIAWIFDFLAIFLTSIQNPLAQIIGLLCLPAFSGFIFYGSVKFLEEESIAVRHRTLAIFSIMPVMFIGYMLGVYFYTGDPFWTATSAAALGISGVFVTTGGLLLMEVEGIYRSAIRYLYVSIILFGVHLVPAALFGKYEWYRVIGFTASSLLVIFMVGAMVKLTSSKTFRPPTNNTHNQPDLKPGVLLIDIGEYKKLKEKLRGTRVLAFLRDVSDVPDEWEYYFVTTIPFQGKFKNTINPTNLARITELSYQYLESFSKSGKHGIIVIDCLEYLTVYNPWESLMKFLSKLRDFAIVNKGTLVVVVEKESLEPRLYSQLRKLLE